MSVPYTFGTATQPLPLSELDDNFTYVENQIASLNASGIAYTPAGTGAVATTVQAMLRLAALTPFAYGAVGDWNGTTGTDDTAAIQACINAALTLNVKRILLGNHKITGGLDLTNLYQCGIIVEPLNRQADNNIANLAVFGATNQGVDISGTEGLMFRDIVIYGDTATPPRCGVFASRTSIANYSQFHKFDNVQFMGSFNKAAMYNYGGEEWDVSRTRFYLTSGHGAYFTSKNSLGLTSAFATTSSATPTLTATNFRDRCTFQIRGTGSIPLWFEAKTSGTQADTNSVIGAIKVDANYFAAADATNTPGPCIRMDDVVGPVTITGNTDESAINVHCATSFLYMTCVGAGVSGDSICQGLTLANNSFLGANNRLYTVDASGGDVSSFSAYGNKFGANLTHKFRRLFDSTINSLVPVLESIYVDTSSYLNAKNVFINASNSTYSQVTLPAGCTALVGNDSCVDYQTPAGASTAFSYTATKYQRRLGLLPVAQFTGATCTITFPPNPTASQTFTITCSFGAAAGKLSLNGNGNSIVAAPTSIADNTTLRWICEPGFWRPF